jgi:hypothetical protein
MTATLEANTTQPIVEERSGVVVVRDDLIVGGTKRAALDELLLDWPEHELVYASPAEGHAQVALAHAARAADRRAVIFVARRRLLSAETRRARAAGIELHEVERGSGRFSVVRADARAYAERNAARLLPTGFASDDFVAAIAARARRLDVDPETVVCVAATGTLLRGLRSAWPDARFVAVRVGMKPSVEPGATLVEAPEAFAQRAFAPPPFPSASHYDAKAWRFALDAAPCLFWNVAG